jgi:DNA/RNA-binding domain of Phe-tRNA-synthetase-like protein
MLASFDELPFAVRKDLPGWLLFWACLERVAGAEDRLAQLRNQVVVGVRERLSLDSLASNPTVAAMRRLFKAAGCDPSRYRPASEALLRRVLKGDELPAISPLVDINNCLSLDLAVPCCVMRDGSFTAPLLWRSGRPGESYQSLRGPFTLEGKPLLLDADGPIDAPISGNEKVKVTPETEKAWLVAYLPEEVVAGEAARDALRRLILAAPVVNVTLIALS